MIFSLNNQTRKVSNILVALAAILLMFLPLSVFATTTPSTTPAAATSTAPAATASQQEGFIPQKPDTYNGPLPPCAFDGTCRDVNDLLTLLINWGQRIFGLIGSIALVMFVIGGFTMIFSAGNAEKVKKGRDTLVAAVIGLTIAFSAYLLINFILNALNVGPQFRGINLQTSMQVDQLSEDQENKS